MSSRHKKSATRKSSKKSRRNFRSRTKVRILGSGVEALEGRRLLAFSDFLFNEVLADPASGADPNGDGTADTSQDEFVEIVNNGPAIDIGGWVLTDASASQASPRHVFPSPTNVAAGQAIVVFGGGTPTGTFGDSIVMTASSGLLGLNNSGDTITFSDNASTATMTYGSEGGNNNSLTRDPDLVGPFFQHNTRESGLDYSPGFGNDGQTPFGGAIAGVLSATETDGSTVVNESGTSDTVNVVLSGIPTANVLVAVTPSNSEVDLGEGAGNTLTLTFTPDNANAAQVITINAFDDSVSEGEHTSTLSFAASSSDTVFDGLTTAPIAVAVQDNDVATFSAGDVVINEVMQNPSAVADANGEYFELWNTTGSAINIDGWVIKDDANASEAHTIDNGGSLSIPANGYLVLGVDGDSATNGGINVDYVYSSVSLGNGADGLIIEDAGGRVIDVVTWDDGSTFPDPNGASMELNPAVANPDADNDNGANWVTSTTSLASGDFGTPGAANDTDVVSPEIDVTGNGVSIVSGDATPAATDDTDFGSSAQGDAAITRTFTIANSGDGLLTIGLLSISGSNDFSITQPASDAVAGGSSETFTVVFTPGSVGIHAATVSIPSDDADESTYTFDVIGDVTANTSPEISIAGNGQPIADGDATPNVFDGTEFGSVDTVTGSLTKTFTISNPGTAELEISAITIGGPDAADFSLGSVPASISAGGNATFDVTFNPSENSLRSAIVTVANNDSDESSYDFAIQGSGLSIAMNLLINEVDSDTTNENNEFIELYDGGVGNTSLDGLVVVLFNGNGSASYDAIDLDGFATDVNGYFVIGDGGIANVDLIPPGFDLAGAGPTFGSDIQNGEDAVAIYVGNETDYPNGTIASSINLLDVLIYETGEDDSTLPADLGITSVADEDANGNKDAESVARVPNGTGSFFAVEPTPGTINATIELSPEIDLTGNGLSIPPGDATPRSADDTDFGSAIQGANAVTRTFTIENSGTGALTVSSVSISGSSDFSVSQPASSIAAGSTGTFTITFTPGDVGSQMASISIANDDADENPYTFDVTGATTAAPTPEIAILGNDLIIADGDTTPFADDFTDFGSVDVANQTVANTFTISNAGTATLTVSSIAISGENSADFTLGATPTSVAAGETETFTVTFAPSANGRRSALITVSSNDGDEASYEFAVQGLGATVATATNVVINEVDPDTADENNEFIELYDGGVGNTPLDGLVLVLFNGNGAVSYNAIDLDGFSTNADGFFLIGDGDLEGVDLVPAGFDAAGNATFGSDIQNGEDGVALYTGSKTDFPNGTAATNANLLDAVVYETGADTDGTLPSDLGVTGVVDEDANDNKDADSISRTTDGTGAFTAATPTPSAKNSVPVSTGDDAIHLNKYLWDINGLPDLHNDLAVGDELIYSFDVTNTGTTVLSNISVSDTLPGLVMDENVVEPYLAYDQLTDLQSPPGAHSSLDNDLASDPNESKLWDNFTVTESTVVDAVSWLGSYDGATPFEQLDTEFEIEIYGDSSGSPGSLLHSFVALGENLKAELQAGGAYKYHAMFPFTTLAADDYWLSITAKISTTADTPSWLWHQGVNPGGSDGYYSFVDPEGIDGTPSPEMLIDDEDLAYTLHAARLVDFDGTLQPGDTIMFMGTYYVTQADIDAGEIMNTATATGIGENGSVTATDSDSRRVTQDAAMTVIATVNGLDSSGGSPATAEVGSAVTWSYEVSNIGNVALREFEVVNEQGGLADHDRSSDENSDGILSPGESWLFIASNAANLGEHTSVTSVTSYTINGQAVSTEVAINYIGVDTSSPVRHADFDQDGFVEFTDFLTLSRNFGLQVAGHSEGDATGDGIVNFADFLVLSNSFGQSIQSLAASAVDEVFAAKSIR